jgi:hypothetical protein
MILWRVLTGMWALWCRAWVLSEELVISNKACAALRIYLYTRLLKMIVGVLTTCHTQYT